MPGIASDRNGVQAAPLATFGADNPPTPALGDLMSAFRSGFLTVEDLTKRGVALPAQLAASQQDLQDQIQIRPLSRQQQVGALDAELAIQPKRAANNLAAEDLKAQQIQFAAESLPILDDTKREQFKQEYQNVLQHGLPSAVDNLFNQVVPRFLPIDQAKLVSKEGEVNMSYKLDLIGKAIAKAEELKLNDKFTGPVEQSATGPKGEVKKTTTVMNQIKGTPVGVPIVTDTKAVDEVKAAQVQAQVSEGIRKEFHQNDTIQAFNKVDSAVNKIRLAATPTSTPFQDMSAIFSFLKVLDPGSTVREGEYATVQNSRGWPDAFRGYYNKAVSGQKLTVEQKSQLLASAEQNYQGQLQNALPAIRQFADLEDEKGLGPGSVVPIEFREKLKTTPTAAGTTSTTVTAAGTTPVISTQDETAAAAEANALPPNVPFFKWNGKDYHNPNYRP